MKLTAKLLSLLLALAMLMGMTALVWLNRTRSS